MTTPLTRIPGGSIYIVCCHIMSKEMPRVTVFPFRHPPTPFRPLADLIKRRLPGTQKADYAMICGDCHDRCKPQWLDRDPGGLEHGTPYEMKTAIGDISLTRPSRR